MALLKDPRNLITLLFIPLLLACILIIARRHHAEVYDQQKISDHSEITDAM